MRPLLVLDLGNVLIHVDFQRFVRRYADRDRGEALRALWHSDLKRALDRGERAPRDWLRDLAGALGRPAPSLDEVAAAWVDVFRPMDGIEARIDAFARRYELWLLSDTDPLHFTSQLEACPFLRRFDRYLVSYARGRVKADPGAFDEVAAQVRAGRPVLFVDDLAPHVAAARAAGVPAALFTGWDALDVETLLPP